jgi:hypothetical protein
MSVVTAGFAAKRVRDDEADMETFTADFGGNMPAATLTCRYLYSKGRLISRLGVYNTVTGSMPSCFLSPVS